MDLLAQLQSNMAKGPEYEPDMAQALPAGAPLVRLIAYYLPQFHPISENDEWWGKGFNEWTNVTKALPRFEGHYQPHLPGGMGFYDLRLPEVLREQALLAKKYGIEGFCFHHYWFHGRRLLETPLQVLLDNPDIDVGFCINWANETWSRRWDASNHEVLIDQHHSAEDDIAFAESLKPLFADRRYIRINGRPLFMVYRPNRLPNAAATIGRWKACFADAGLEVPYIIMPQAGDEIDPRKYGLDAAAGFPPHNCGWENTNIRSSLRPYSAWQGEQIVPYDDIMKSAIVNDPVEFTLMPGVCPGWDNMPRRPKGGLCFIGSKPAKYGAWLQNACEKVLRFANADERIVFINAWNEWAEGAHLEPDIHYGYAFLSETARVLQRLDGAGTARAERRPFSEIQREIYRRQEKRPFFRRLLRGGAWMMAGVFEAVAGRLRSLGEALR